MRILLAHNSTYYPGHGGGDVSNRLLIEALAARGHDCLVVSRTDYPDLLAELAHRDVTATVEEPGIARFVLNRVEVHTAMEGRSIRDYFARQLRAFAPDAILASTDDPAQLLLTSALEAHVPVVYLARATIALPFGPDSAFPGADKTATLRRVSGMVGVSQYVADYIRQWSGIEAVHLPISFMGGGPFPNLGNFANEFVTLVNPCAVKGIDMLTAIAARMPEIRFAAVPTWGTNEEDFAKLRAHRNITVLQPEDRVDPILARTRVLLVPSLWAEARSRMVMEAMLRGVPVIASDTGGLPEAKLGVPYVLPVNPIQKYERRLDSKMVPVAVAPAQEPGAWIEALSRLTADEPHWNEIAGQSRQAAHEYLETKLRIEPFEDFLKQAGIRKPPAAHAVTTAIDKDRLRALALRLREQWLAPAELHLDEPNLLCFPYAGAGALAFRHWRDALPAFTVRYPDKAQSVEEVVDALMTHIAPKLRGRFAFFGHSMGAGIAFEFVRALRRASQPLPAALFVSAATAAQLRTSVAPEPTDEELLAVLARIHGPGAPEKALRALLTRFAPDARLHRRYVYREEAPLEIPIRAYGGAEDASVPAERLQAWSAQSTAGFRMRLFPGGHMYLDDPQSALLKTLREDLDELLSS